ncbi:MAG: gliding motility-associated C-terminal domain-containing protein [Fluviicola sp.]
MPSFAFLLTVYNPLKKQGYLFILFVVLSSSLSAQNQRYVCNNNGIYQVDFSSCSTQLIFSAWSTLELTDLAVTPSGELYATNFEKVFKIDTLTGDALLIGAIDSPIYGFNSLVAINDDCLLAVRTNSELSKINLTSGTISHLGYLGYYPLGDLTFFKGKYYLAATGNKLVRFDYNRATDEISSIELVGVMETTNPNHAIYGLTTIGNATCDSSDSLKLIAFEFNEAFEVDPKTANCTQICVSNPFVQNIKGAASKDEALNQVFEKDLSMTVPNIFTPNGDQINDFFEPQDYMWEISNSSISVFNRWGNLVFSRRFNGYYQWDGTTESGEICPDGIYYYKLVLKGYCDTESELNGFIQLIR